MINNNNKELIKSQERISWIDCLKFIAIFFIYLGHFCDASGKFYGFVFIFHVPLFFICSGFFAKNYEKLSFKEFIFKTIKRLLIPVESIFPLSRLLLMRTTLITLVPMQSHEKLVLNTKRDGFIHLFFVFVSIFLLFHVILHIIKYLTRRSVFLWILQFMDIHIF